MPRDITKDGESFQMNLMKLLALSAVAVAGLLPLSAFADPFTIKDVAGREVSFDKPVERVILGEGRMLYAVAPIEKDDPFAKIVGWRNDLWTTDKDGFNAYVEKFPKGKDLPFLGNLTDGTLQTETASPSTPTSCCCRSATRAPPTRSSSRTC
jgi:iron complex transport system substrate-binding protein